MHLCISVCKRIEKENHRLDLNDGILTDIQPASGLCKGKISGIKTKQKTDRFTNNDLANFGKVYIHINKYRYGMYVF